MSKAESWGSRHGAVEVDGAIQMKNIKDIPGVSWRLSVLGNEEGLVHMCHVGLDSAGGYCRVPESR